MSEAVVKCSTNDREPAGAGEPPCLPESLFFLCIVATNNGHEPSWDNTFDESWFWLDRVTIHSWVHVRHTKKETLHKQSAP